MFRSTINDHRERFRNALLRQDVKYFRLHLQSLKRRNSSTKRPIIATGGPIVSLTSHGDRLNSVFLAIESIAGGSILPSRIILWLESPIVHQTLPDTLKRLESRGLEIRVTRNYGPHSKYFPYVDTAHTLDEPLITADDDMLYPHEWLSGLITAYRQAPHVLNCYRAHVIPMADSAISAYASWTACNRSEPSFLNFATGVSGSILPPKLLQGLKAAGTAFVKRCPTADDIWLHVNSVRQGIRVKQVKAWQQNFAEIPGGQGHALSKRNCHQCQNDVQIATTYAIDDLTVLNNEAQYQPYPRIESHSIRAVQ